MEILKQTDLKNSESTFESAELREKFLEKYKKYGLLTLRVSKEGLGEEQVVKYDLKKDDLSKLVRDYGSDNLRVSWSKHPEAPSYMQNYFTARQPVTQCSTLSVLSNNDFSPEKWELAFDFAYLTGYTIVMASYNTQFLHPEKTREGFEKLGFKHFLTYHNRRTRNQIYQMYKHLEPCL